MTSDSKTLSSPKLKKAPIRMVVTSFGLGRGKRLSGKDLVSQKLQTPDVNTQKSISPTKQLSPVKIASQGKMNEISKAPSPAKLAKVPSPLKLMQPTNATANILTEEEVERMYGKPPSPKNMVVQPNKLSPSLISTKLKTLETVRQPARGVGENRIPALNKRNPYTNVKANAHKNVVEKYNVIDLPKIQPTKQLSPAMISSGNRFDLGNVKQLNAKPVPRNVKSPQTYTHTPVVKSMKVMLYKPDEGYKGDKNGENAVIKLGRGDIDGAFEEFKKGCMHFDRQCSYYDPMIQKSFDAFKKRLIAKYTKAVKDSLAKGRNLDAELAFRAAWLASGKDDNDMLIYEEYIEQYPPKATSPDKKVSPGLKPYKPSNTATKFPSKGTLTQLSKKAMVMPGKLWTSQFDPETGKSKIPWENKAIQWLNEGADTEAYDVFFEGYYEFDPSVGDYAPRVEQAYNMLKKRLSEYNMKAAKEAYAKYNYDEALEYFTKSWLNDDKPENKSQIQREFDKQFRLNNNEVSRALPTKTKPVSPGWTNPSITKDERRTLEVRRDEIIDVLNDLVRNITISVTGVGSIKVFCGDINIAHDACVEALDDGFKGKGKIQTTLGKEIRYNGVSIKFSVDRSRKLKQQRGTYRGYKYQIDPVEGTYGIGINAITYGYDIYDGSDEYKPMHYTDEELLQKVKHEIDIKIGTKPSPKAKVQTPSVPKPTAQKTTAPKPVVQKPQPEKKVQKKKVVAPKVVAKQISPVKRVSPIVAPERKAEVDTLKAEIAELSRQINEKAKIGIKATDLINAMNVLVMKKAAIAGVRKGNKR